MTAKKIFISFSSQEQSLAFSLKEVINNAYDDTVDVFVSNSSITAGEQWSEEIRKNIRSADLLLVLCSPASIRRQWINFECGAIAYVKEKKVPIIPICHSGLTQDEVPKYFTKEKALDLHSYSFCNDLAEKIDDERTIQRKSLNKDTIEKAIRTWFNKPTESQKHKKVQIVSLSYEDGVVGINPEMSINEPETDLSTDEWLKKIHLMHAFLRDPDNNPINSVGVAIGIQNCLFDGKGLSVGVRLKSTSDNYSSGVGICMGMFNTGYALLRPDNIDDINLSESLQDLFEPKQKYLKYKKFVERFDNVYTTMERAAAIKGEKLWHLRLADGRELVATLFVNNSHRFPRFEIGVWKYIDISLIEKDFINGFGNDKFQTCAWLWARNGVVRYWSYPEERLIPRNNPVPSVNPQHSVLLSTACMRDIYGNPACYTPFASDESLKEISVNPEKFIKEPFSAPARALLSCF